MLDTLWVKRNRSESATGNKRSRKATDHLNIGEHGGGKRGKKVGGKKVGGGLSVQQVVKDELVEVVSLGVRYAHRDVKCGVPDILYGLKLLLDIDCRARLDDPILTSFDECRT